MNLPVAWPEPGTYLLAVSGGADSMVLLHLMRAAAAARGYTLVVAHVDHGLRAESDADRQLVQSAAQALRLPFIFTRLQLSSHSETAARSARHAWLDAERAQLGAVLVTAHHQDDLIETSLLNLARGSGRRGLAPMHTGDIVRPLLGISREELRAHAKTHGVLWHEDPTNAQLFTPRNLVRHRLLPAAPAGWAERYQNLTDELAELNLVIDSELPMHFSRALPLTVLAEAIAAGIRRAEPGLELRARTLQELALFAKTGRAGARRSVSADFWLIAQYKSVTLGYTKRVN